ncbi:PucR family transcriptional regulator [Gordonia crocea]|uniref:Transcriptional regulator n=1 Tax=Gordonia crocea TaxID=589162 RepID=A0A7M3SVL8_9ACTN|nr:helix-turn-helix domain-containing protein [Gordonia crocea]GED96692.1 transcriptional regulator [Gordonia crocea]
MTALHEPAQAGSPHAFPCPPLRLVDHLAQRTAALVAEVVTRICAEVDFYRSLPAETVKTDVTRIVRRNFEIMLRVLRTGEPPSDDDLADLIASAGNRADEQVPLSDVLDAYHVGARHWWATIAGLAQDGTRFAEGDLVRIGDLHYAWLRAATRAVIAGYDADDLGRPSEPRPGRSELLAALIDGGRYREVAARFHLTVEPEYWAVAVAVEPNPDETDAMVSSTVAAARKVRRLQRQFDGLGRGEALYSLTAGGGIALLPVRPAPHAESTTAPPDAAELDDRLRQLGERMAARTTCAVDLVRADEVAEVVPQLRDLLSIAQRQSSHRPVVRFADLAVEFQLSRPTRASRLSAARLDPIADDAVLWQTLRCYLDNACSTATTAQELHVHPNTVTYRLRKVSDLTGLNLGNPADVLTALGAVLAATPRPDSAGCQRADLYGHSTE